MCSFHDPYAGTISCHFVAFLQLLQGGNLSPFASGMIWCLHPVHRNRPDTGLFPPTSYVFPASPATATSIHVTALPLLAQVRHGGEVFTFRQWYYLTASLADEKS